MKKITVYADFDFLASPQEIGTLGYERVRGKDHFVFEYSREWLKQHGGIVLSGDLVNVPSLQHPRSTDSVFGFVKDSFPDRWGRLLLDRRERLKAQAEGSPVQMLTNYDYLTGIEDFTRMGGIRYKLPQSWFSAYSERVDAITCIRHQSWSVPRQLTNEARAEDKLACTMPCKKEEGESQQVTWISSRRLSVPLPTTMAVMLAVKMAVMS